MTEAAITILNKSARVLIVSSILLLDTATALDWLAAGVGSSYTTLLSTKVNRLSLAVCFLLLVLNGIRVILLFASAIDKNWKRMVKKWVLDLPKPN